MPILAFESIKNKFDQWSVKKRFDKNRQAKIDKKKKADEALKDALKHPEETKTYNRALHQLARYQTGQNLIALGKWVIYDTFLILIAYIPYGQFQAANTQLMISGQAHKINGFTANWAQNNIYMYIAMTAVISALIGYLLIKHGWYHRPYKKGNLLAYIQDLQDNKTDQDPDKYKPTHDPFAKTNIKKEISNQARSRAIKKLQRKHGKRK